MFARAEFSAAAAWEMIDQVISEDGLANLLQAMEGHRQNQQPITNNSPTL
jgi:hypothetical protein